MPVATCQLHHHPRHVDDRGALLAVEHPGQVPFPIARCFVTSEMKAGVARGGHAHKECHEYLLCLHGRVRITASDPSGRDDVMLEADGTGYHLTPMSWIDIVPATDDAILMVLCSHGYDPDDYLHDRATFDRMAQESLP